MKSHKYPRGHKSTTDIETFLFGAPYYPEHWTKADMEHDAERMKEAGFNIVRIGEFAWDRMEPEEGTYDFTFFDQHIAALGQVGIRTMLCTPTATPPTWLTEEHPEVLRVAEDGKRMMHGSRQHACDSSRRYRKYSRKITNAMSAHFAQNPHVVGWQTDNELFCHFSECHCGNCEKAFRIYLKEKYNSIDELNRRWGTAFWALTYNSFDQVTTPHADRPTHVNPSQYLDYHLFLTSEVTDFQNEQVAILREANPDWWITHNGLMRNIDYRPFTRELDFLGVDVYPMFASAVDRAAEHARVLDAARSFAGNFVVPELQSGPGGQGDYFHDNPAPGQMRLFAWKCVARGADGILHFRWRTCRFGAEQYWCGILDHDNQPRRRYVEACQEGAEFARLGSEILGTHLEPEVGVLYDSGLAELGHWPITCGLPSPNTVATTMWRAFWEEHYSVGFVHPEDDLEGLKLIVMPSWAIVTAKVALALEAFVDAGGTLIITARSGVKNEDSHVISETPPGLLARLSGCLVEEATRINEPEVTPNSFALEGVEIKAAHFLEMLQPTTGEPVALWKNGHQAGKVAVVKNRFGRGVCLYVGTYPDAVIAGQLAAHVIELAGVRPLIPGLPKNIEVSVRVGENRRLWFLNNNGNCRETINEVPAGLELISGKNVDSTLEIGPLGVAVIRTE